MTRPIPIAVVLLACVSVAWPAGVSNEVLYQIDVDSNPGSNGEVSSSITIPGQWNSIVHPRGKGDAAGLADYSLLRARARLDPDFPTDQTSAAHAHTAFDDVLTISGSNNGSIAEATFALSVRGTIRQPFYVTEVAGAASAAASLFAGSDLQSNSDNGAYAALGPEPILVSFDDTLLVKVLFTVGQPVSLVAGLDASAEAELTVAPGVEDFLADFLDGAALQPIGLSGVDNPVISSESGHHYLVQNSQASSGDVTGLTVGKAGGDLSLKWYPSCMATDGDYAVYQGSFGAWTSFTSSLCTTGGWTTVLVTPPAANTYYLVVPTNGGQEGSYGASSAGERPPAAGACGAQVFIGCP